jgi:hypothetical protein
MSPPTIANTVMQPQVMGPALFISAVAASAAYLLALA